MTEVIDSPLVEKQVEPEWMQLAREVSDNSAAVKFPTDKWGFTSDLRKALLKAAGGTNGVAAKEELLIGTIMVGLAHIKKRKDKERRLAQQRLEYQAQTAKEREPLERFGLQTVTPKKDEAE